ncbi:hypothetical protein EV356DRAFT_510375 [Viridothelium virens]|uniref:Nascent polypeptide-associated complex subunit alpha-like UBA domain-containing protein n=1 Tax=Viridothelium virens TaxID=1048519 RepID=A0A6A6GV00_VIRVR|nr:hypothetical protein EV356DRAFT_510375 [Viridothelium virens]
MAEPQPASIHEGADPDAAEASENPSVPATADDRKAAAALSSLETHGGAEDEESGRKKLNVDADALGKAMRNLEIVAGENRGGAKGKEEVKKEEVKRVKVEAKDVVLMVEQLDLSKLKATDLLKAHDGDPIKAMTAYVTAPV